MTPRAGVFRREPPTRLYYAALAAYAFWLYAFGPTLALLRAEPHFSYTLLGPYSALWSVGAAVAGLFLCGLGVASLYPLSLALTLAAAPGNGDAANGATQLLGGELVTASPYLLGRLADHLGLHTAFAIEPVLIGLCAVLLLAGLRLARPPEGGIAPPQAAQVNQRLESR